MNDTSPEIARVYSEMLMARNGAERLAMACDMFDAARELMVARMRAQGVEPTADAIFLRTYGRDFTFEERERILARLTK